MWEYQRKRKASFYEWLLGPIATEPSKEDKDAREPLDIQLPDRTQRERNHRHRLRTSTSALARRRTNLEDDDDEGLPLLMAIEQGQSEEFLSSATIRMPSSVETDSSSMSCTQKPNTVRDSICFRPIRSNDVSRIKELHEGWFPVSYHEDFYTSLIRQEGGQGKEQEDDCCDAPSISGQSSGDEQLFETVLCDGCRPLCLLFQLLHSRLVGKRDYQPRRMAKYRYA